MECPCSCQVSDVGVHVRARVGNCFLCVSVSHPWSGPCPFSYNLNMNIDIDIYINRKMGTETETDVNMDVGVDMDIKGIVSRD